MKIDLEKQPDTIESINTILNNNAIAEVKTEKGGDRIVVVEINRNLRHSEQVDSNDN